MTDQRVAVITGDVINSGEIDQYGQSLDAVFREVESEYREHLHLGVDRYSGDQFQLLLKRCRLSLRVSLYIYTRLASFETPIDVRLSVGFGRIKRFPDERVSMGEGDAFRRSGSMLDEIKKHQRIQFDLGEDVHTPVSNEWMNSSMDLLSGLCMELTKAQAEVIWYKLQDDTQQEIARKTDRKQQSVSDLCIAGHWRNVERFLAVFEDEMNTGE